MAVEALPHLLLLREALEVPGRAVMLTAALAVLNSEMAPEEAAAQVVRTTLDLMVPIPPLLVQAVVVVAVEQGPQGPQAVSPPL